MGNMLPAHTATGFSTVCVLSSEHRGNNYAFVIHCIYEKHGWIRVVCGMCVRGLLIHRCTLHLRISHRPVCLSRFVACTARPV